MSFCHWHKHGFENSFHFQVVWDAMTLIWHHCNGVTDGRIPKDSLFCFPFRLGKKCTDVIAVYADNGFSKLHCSLDTIYSTRAWNTGEFEYLNLLGTFFFHKKDTQHDTPPWLGAGVTRCANAGYTQFQSSIGRNICCKWLCVVYISKHVYSVDGCELGSIILDITIQMPQEEFILNWRLAHAHKKYALLIITGSCKTITNLQFRKYFHACHCFVYLPHFNPLRGQNKLTFRTSAREVFNYTWQALQLTFSGILFRVWTQHPDSMAHFVLEIRWRVRINDAKPSCNFWHKLCYRSDSMNS